MKKKNEIKHQLYNPSWIVKLAEKQLPEKQEFIQAWFGCSPKFFNFNFDNPYKGIKNIEQIPEKSDIIKILKKCTKVYAYCECGCGDPYFVVSGLKELKEKNFLNRFCISHCFGSGGRTFNWWFAAAGTSSWSGRIHFCFYYLFYD